MTDTIAIEKNIPLDTSRGNGGRGKYPFRKLEVGDSFIYPRNIQQASSYASVMAKMIGGGVKFACRTLDESSTRVWRVE